MTGLILTAVSGALRGERYAFPDKTIILLGRCRDCDLRLSDATVSRRHCLIDVAPTGVWVRDLESLNGTFINGLRLGKSAEGQRLDPCLCCRRLLDGDELCVGEFAFVVTLPAEEEESANPVPGTAPLAMAVA